MQDTFDHTIDKATAYRIINDLRTGKPPHEYVNVIHVGYGPLLDYFREKLDEIKEFGTSDVKFINADYGRGKSHFLDLIRLLAFERGFVVSRVELNQRDVPFDKLEIVIQKVMANICTDRYRENGFEKLLRQWATDNRGRSDHALYDSLDDLSLPTLRSNIAQFAKEYNSEMRNQRRLDELLQWFRGETVRGRTRPNVREYLHNITCFFRLIGYSGFVIMLDEAEAISSLTRGTRGEVANENIRQIIDNDQGTEGFYFVFASTPTFFAAPPGGRVRKGDPISIYSYDALRRRVENLPGLTDPQSPYSVVVELPDLEEEDFLALARRIRDIAETAYGKPPTPIGNAQIEALVRYVRSSEQRVATLVRSVVAICDKARLPNFSFESQYELTVEQQRDQVNRSASQ